MEQAGLIHIYCGDGKGKTTAAVGAAIRAAGRGKRVFFVRFLKTDDSGEVASLHQLPGVTLLPCKRSFGFSWEMSEDQKKEASRFYGEMFHHAWNTAAEEAYDMLVMDEIIGACGLGFIDEAAVCRALEEKPACLEIIMTGRSPSPRLEELADYMTEMVMKKHPYTCGIGAREGIEY